MSPIAERLHALFTAVLERDGAPLGVNLKRSALLRDMRRNLVGARALLEGRLGEEGKETTLVCATCDLANRLVDLARRNGQ